MFSMFDRKLPYVWAFSPAFDDVRQLFRENIVGGLSNIYHRHVNTTDEINTMNEDTEQASKYAPNGDRFNYLTFLDFNSMVNI